VAAFHGLGWGGVGLIEEKRDWNKKTAISFSKSIATGKQEGRDVESMLLPGINASVPEPKG